jgi:Ca2+:H+ antiporter
MFIILLIFVPLSIFLNYTHQVAPIWVFLTSIIAIVPLSVWIQRSTEQLSIQAGPSIGGLLNVTFGNAAELILALFVLSAGSAGVVKGQITGSMIGNGLLGLGLAVLVGSHGKYDVSFNREHASLLSSLLILVVIGLLLPALFNYTERSVASASQTSLLDEYLSLGVSIVLILLYVANLIYTLYTHRDIFGLEEGNQSQPNWPLWKSLGILLIATAVTALEAELISGALEASASQIGVSTFFLGVIVLAIVGNAAEYLSAVYFAHKGQMSTAMSITVGSSIQVGLLIAPILVLVSYAIGHPMNLVFDNPLEMIAIAAVAFAVNAIAEDGVVTWFEGALLLGVYIMLGMAFFFVTPG